MSLPRIKITNYRDIDRGRTNCAFDLVLPDLGVRLNDIRFVEEREDSPYVLPWIPFLDRNGRAERRTGGGWHGYRAGFIKPGSPITHSLAHVLTNVWTGGPNDPKNWEVR